MKKKRLKNVKKTFFCWLGYNAKWNSIWIHNFPHEARFQVQCSLYLFYILRKLW